MAPITGQFELTAEKREELTQLFESFLDEAFSEGAEVFCEMTQTPIEVGSNAGFIIMAAGPEMEFRVVAFRGSDFVRRSIESALSRHRAAR